MQKSQNLKMKIATMQIKKSLQGRLTMHKKELISPKNKCSSLEK